MDRNRLIQTLTDYGLNVKDVNVSPRGIITITIIGEWGQERKPFDVFRELGIQTKLLPGDLSPRNKDLKFRVI